MLLLRDHVNDLLGVEDAAIGEQEHLTFQVINRLVLEDLGQWFVYLGAT